MKVLQVNCVYPEKSTGKIVCCLHQQLQRDGYESVVCYGRGRTLKEPHVYKTCGELYSKVNHLWSYLTGLMYGGCALSTNRLIGIIKQEKPDVVHLHCLNGYFVNLYRLIAYLRDAHIPTVLTLHAEFMHTGNCGHALDCDRWKIGCGHCPRLRRETKSLLFDRTHTSWTKMKRAFEGFDDLTVVSVSPWLMERAKQSPILADKRHCVILNGVDTDIFHPYDTSELKRCHGLTDEKIIFHSTAHFSADPDHIKGGYYVLELAKRLSGENIRFFVAGEYDSSIVPPDHVVLLGRITDQKLLAHYYSMADVTLLTSKKETFSMVCAESLCCGTPVVGFKAGGPEQISLPEYSEFVEYGDLIALCEKLKMMLNNNHDFVDTALKALKYSDEKMYKNYLDKYNYLLVYRKN